MKILKSDGRNVDSGRPWRFHKTGERFVTLGVTYNISGIYDHENKNAPIPCVLYRRINTKKNPVSKKQAVVWIRNMEEFQRLFVPEFAYQVMNPAKKSDAKKKKKRKQK